MRQGDHGQRTEKQESARDHEGGDVVARDVLQKAFGHGDRLEEKRFTLNTEHINKMEENTLEWQPAAAALIFFCESTDLLKRVSVLVWKDFLLVTLYIFYDPL